MKIAHYSVFAAAPGGGKQFAIVEGVDNPVEMQRIAAQTGQPLTGFILNTGPEPVEARFFSPSKEKGASDSGALVIGEHLRRLGRAGDSLTVLMGEEGLEVFCKDGLWFSHQADYSSFTYEAEPVKWLELLQIEDHYLASPPEGVDPVHELGRSGTGEKKNMVVMVYPQFMDSITVDLVATKRVCQETQVNGLVLLANSPQGADWDFRFFAPHKGIQEDNAGSFTLATVCGFMASFHPAGSSPLIQQAAIQGRAMGKLSRLYANYSIKDSIAQNIRVGGKVEPLEVSHD